MKNPIKRFFRTLTGADSREGVLLERLNRVEKELGQARMYQAAMVNRLTSDFGISITSANAETLVSAKAVRSRNQGNERDNTHFRRGLRLTENNVVGHRGVRLGLKIKGKDGKLDRDTCEKVMCAWKKWTRREFCTVSRNLSFREVCNLTSRARKRDGGIIHRIYPNFGNDFKFAIQPIDIARLDHDFNTPQNGLRNLVQFGIEVDQYKAPVAYHILTRNPGDVFAYSPSPSYRERVPAELIIPVWSIERPEHFIGMPSTCSVTIPASHIAKYDEAEVVAARAAACAGGWFVPKNPDGTYKGPEDAQGNTEVKAEPGSWEELPPGLEPIQRNPLHPTDAYPAFIKSQLRNVASGFDMSYVSLANDLEGVNLSSIRHGLYEEHEDYMVQQADMEEQLCDPVFVRWLPFAILSGQIQISMSELERLKCQCWKFKRWASLDPLKDTEAALMRINGNLSSYRQEIGEDGEDIEAVWEDKEEDAKLAEQHGIDLTPPDKQAPAPAHGETETEPATNGKQNVNGNGRFVVA